MWQQMSASMSVCVLQENQSSTDNVSTAYMRIIVLVSYPNSASGRDRLLKRAGRRPPTHIEQGRKEDYHVGLQFHQ